VLTLSIQEPTCKDVATRRACIFWYNLTKMRLKYMEKFFKYRNFVLYSNTITLHPNLAIHDA
jgi:hypothetical protein